MLLKINGSKFYGESKEECLNGFLKQQFTNSDDDKVIEEVYRCASEYIIENCATDEEIEDLDPSYDLFGKYCTDEILLHSFEELINNNPVIYRGIRFEEDDE